MATVLTVDDSKVVRSMVTRHLQPYGGTVVEATNGQEGVDPQETFDKEVSKVLGAPGAGPGCRCLQ